MAGEKRGGREEGGEAGGVERGKGRGGAGGGGERGERDKLATRKTGRNERLAGRVEMGREDQEMGGGVGGEEERCAVTVNAGRHGEWTRSSAEGREREREEASSEPKAHPRGAEPRR